MPQSLKMCYQDLMNTNNSHLKKYGCHHKIYLVMDSTHTPPTLPLPSRFNHTTITLGTQWEVRVVVECTGNTASSKWHLSEIWTWSSRSINTQSNRDLNPGVLDIWSEVGHPSLNGSQVITRTSSWLIHTARHSRTHRQKQAMAIPEDQNMPRVKI